MIAVSSVIDGGRTDAAVPLEADDLEAWAERNLPRMVFDFVAGGAGAEVTMEDNRQAFARCKLLPRHLRNVESVDASIEILGLSLDAPILVAPMALHRLMHGDGERGMARAASAAGLAMVFSTAASQSIEEVGSEGCPLWFQLYMQKDRGVTRDLVARAVDSGVRAMCLTVDTPVPGLRRRDIVNDFRLPDGIGYANLDRYAGSPHSDNRYGATLDRSATWEDVEWLRSVSGLAVVVKGVLTVDDARAALDSGAAAVGVSNHGGRQLDGAPATIDVLPVIAEAVDGDGVVLVDGGIRRASDIAAALCLGADAVLIGRPALWALAYGGEAGARRFLTNLVDDLVRTLTLLGARTVSELNTSLVWKQDVTAR